MMRNNDVIKTDAKMLKGKELAIISNIFGITRKFMESDEHLRSRLTDEIRSLPNGTVITVPYADGIAK